MDIRARNHLALALSHAADLQARAFEKTLQRNYGEFSRAGRFHSVMRIVRSIELMEEAIKAYLATAMSTARKLSPHHVAFVIAAVNCQRFANRLKEQIPYIVWTNGQPNPKDQAGIVAATRVFDQCKRDLGVLLKLAEFDFDLEKPVTVAEIAVNTGLERFLPGDREKRLPNLPEPKFQTWWRGLGVRRDRMSLLELVASVQTAFPDNRVTRQRIRDVASGRKRGPKQFG